MQRGLSEMVRGVMNRRMVLRPLPLRVSGASEGLTTKWLMHIVRCASFISKSSLSSGFSSSGTGFPNSPTDTVINLDLFTLPHCHLSCSSGRVADGLPWPLLSPTVPVHS